MSLLAVLRALAAASIRDQGQHKGCDGDDDDAVRHVQGSCAAISHGLQAMTSVHGGTGLSSAGESSANSSVPHGVGVLAASGSAGCVGVLRGDEWTGTPFRLPVGATGPPARIGSRARGGAGGIHGVSIALTMARRMGGVSQNTSAAAMEDGTSMMD